MQFSCVRFTRRAALAVAAVGGVVGCFVAAPSRGQQSVPALGLVAPATASGANTGSAHKCWG